MMPDTHNNIISNGNAKIVYTRHKATLKPILFTRYLGTDPSLIGDDRPFIQTLMILSIISVHRILFITLKLIHYLYIYID